MKKIWLFGLLALSLFLASCGFQTGSTIFEKNNETSENIADNNKAIAEEVVPLNCDDQNTCTDDKWNAETKKCDFIAKKPCCGNNICEDNEGCNTLTYKTACQSDCGLRCEAKLEVLGTNCQGSCSLTNIGMVFSGTGKVVFELVNLGEKPMEDLDAEVKCKQKSGSAKYTSYFNDNKDKLSLKSKEKGYYYIELKQPDTFNFDCDVIFKSDYSVSFNSINIVGQ